MKRDRRKDGRSPRKVLRPGEMVEQLVRDNDIDHPPDVTEFPLRIREARDGQEAAIRQGAAESFADAESRMHAELGRYRGSVTALQDREDGFEKDHRKKLDRYEREADTADRWRDLGLAERLRVVTWFTPTWMYYGLLAILFGADFWIFANAMAVLENVEASPDNPIFWVGGAIGGVVFLAGFLLGRSIKEAVKVAMMARIQEEAEADGRADEVPDVGRIPFITMVLSGAVFTSALILVWVIRRQSGVEESLAAVMLQMLVPVMVVFAKYFLYDPLEIRRPQRTRRHALIRNNRIRAEEALAAAEEKWQAELAGIRMAEENEVEANRRSWAEEERRLRIIFQERSKFIDEAALEDYEAKRAETAKQRILSSMERNEKPFGGSGGDGSTVLTAGRGSTGEQPESEL